MQFRTIETKDKTPSKEKASLTTATTAPMERTNNPNPKRISKKRKMNTIQSNAGSVTKQDIPKLGADHEKAKENR